MHFVILLSDAEEDFKIFLEEIEKFKKKVEKLLGNVIGLLKF